MQNLEEALAAFRNILGHEHVQTDEPARAAAQSATFSTTQRVPAVIMPASRGEVQECVRIANRHKVPIYPVSTGKNWGYGSSVPVRDGSVVMTLSRMNRIVEFSEELAYITVEPGVTMRQIFEHLRQRGSKLMLSVTGSTPDSSLIGNICDRGMGAGVNAERAAHLCDLEVVLPTGECVQTGFSRFAGAQASRVNRWGVGPHLDGLFTQSNLGIVTQVTIWLAPLPKHHQIFIFRLDDDRRMEGVVDAIRELKLQGIPRPSVSLWNDYKLLSMRRQYPWDEASGQTPLPEAVMAKLRRAWGGAAWLGGGAIFAASRAEALAERDIIRRALGRRVDKLVFIDRRAATIARLLKRPIQRLTGLDLGEIVRAYEESPHLGIPMEKNIRSAYWRKRVSAPEDLNPDRDRCGAIWLSPAIPSAGNHVAPALRAIQRITRAHQFEPNMSAIFATERCANLVVAIMYDRDVAGEDDRAMACYRELFHHLAEQGYLPYRLGIQSMDALPPSHADYGSLMSTLKRALDPNDILAPGRYDFRHEWPEGSDTLSRPTGERAGTLTERSQREAPSG